MNKLLILICVLFFFNEASAQQKQSKQLILGVADFTANTPQQKKFTNVLKEQVTDVLNKTGRFKLVDIDGSAREQSFKMAKKNYKAEKWITEDMTIHAEHTLTAFIGNIKFIKLNGGKGYKATIAYTLKILNTESGKIINNGTHTFSSTESAIKLTPETALQSAIETTNEELNKYIISFFPIKVGIAKIEEEKKGKAVSLILSGGSENGIEKGQTFTTKYIDYSMGSAYPKEIGRIKIIEVVNEQFSKAKVIKGGLEILKHFTASDEITNIIVK